MTEWDLCVGSLPSKPLPIVAKHAAITWTGRPLMTVSSIASLWAAATQAVFGLGSGLFYVVPALLFPCR